MRWALASLRVAWFVLCVVMLIRSRTWPLALLWSVLAGGNVLAIHYFATRWGRPR